MWKLVYGASASFGAILQYAFVVKHPGAMLQHPLDMVGANFALLLTTYCAWQFVHNGQAVNKLLAKRKRGKDAGQRD